MDVITKGNFNQFDSRFVPLSRGKQCTPICCVALCYSEVVNVANWTPYDLDKIITLGDAYYKVSKQYLADKNQSTNFMYFNLDLVYPKIIIDQYQCYFTENILYDENDKLVHIEENFHTSNNLLANAIKKFFIVNNFTKGIFICNYYSLSVWFINDVFYLFDSHIAFCFRTKLIDQLVLQLVKSCNVVFINGIAKNTAFSLTSVKIKINKDFLDPQAKARIDLEYNSGAEISNREKRLMFFKDRQIKKISMESPEEKERRLLKLRENEKKKISLESEEEKQKRLEKMRENEKKKISLESEEEKQKRLEKMRENKKNKLNLETKEEKQKRLEKRRENRKNKITLESNEEKQKRLQKRRDNRMKKISLENSKKKDKQLPKEWDVLPNATLKATKKRKHDVIEGTEVQISAGTDVEWSCDESLAKKSKLFNSSQHSEDSNTCMEKTVENFIQNQQNNTNSTQIKQKQINNDINIFEKVKVSVKSSDEDNSQSDILNFIKLRNLFKLNISKIDLLQKVPNGDRINIKIKFEAFIDKILSNRISIVDDFCKNFLQLRKHFEALKLKADELTDLDAKFLALTGPSLHTKHSALYFAAASNRNPPELPKVLIVNEEDQICNIFETKTDDTWLCNTKHCKIDKEKVYERLINIIEGFLSLKCHDVLPYLGNMDNCKIKDISDIVSTRGGHPIQCYENDICDSVLLFLRILSSHYTKYRTILRLVYKVLKNLKNYKLFSECLEKPVLDLEELTSVCETKISMKSVSFKIGEFAYREENEIEKQFATAFRALKKIQADVPINVCISCLKLCLLRNVKKIENIKISNKVWEDIKNAQNTTEFKYLCLYCFGKIKDGKIPPTCFMNKLDFKEPPEVIQNLNEFEKIFIQRAKAFQTITRKTTVSGGFNKNKPMTSGIHQLHGRTIHLNIPIEETYKKMAMPTDPIIKDQEFYVLVRTLPSKQKTWERLVNISNVHKALEWLRDNNILYKEIKLPKSPQELLKQIKNCDVPFNPQIENVEDPTCLDNLPKLPQSFTDLNEFDSDEGDPIVNDNNINKAMVTQRNITDKCYENLTVYPVHEPRKNNTPSEIYQLLKVEAEAINERDSFLDLKCFPDLFPYGEYGQSEERQVKLGVGEYIKTLLMSAKSQFRKNIQYLFYLLNNANLRQINAGIFTKMKVTTATSNLSAKKCLELLKNKELEGNLSTIFARLRNTKQYWSRFKNDLRCMIKEYGPATFFLTLSPCEYHNERLLNYLCDVNGIKGKRKLSSLPYLIVQDPVSTSRFIENEFQAMLRFLTTPNGPLGTVTHYAWRREYQSRGLQHFHLLLWVKDAPILGKSSMQEVADFISKYISCHLPNKETFRTLHERVTKYQMHRHNSYCLRNKKGKNGKSFKVCRFGFSREESKHLVINNVANAIAGRRKLTRERLYTLPRTAAEVDINDYNPAVLLAWPGNMDIQFIGEESSALTTYISKYQTKPEKSYAATDFQDLVSTKSLFAKLYCYAMRTLSHRECGSLEAADALLQISLFGTDPGTTIRWLDVRIERARKIKDKQTVEQLSDGEDIFCPNWIDTHYPRRPIELEEMNLLDFSRWYDIVTSKPSSPVIFYPYGDGYLRKRKIPYLLNHFEYNPKQQPENYYYSLLLLFVPWRNTESLKGDSPTYTEAFSLISEKLTEAMKYHDRLEYIANAREKLEKEVEKLMSKHNDKEPDKDEDNFIVENNDIIDEIQAFQNQIEEQNLDLDEFLSKLNVDQKNVFDKALDHVEEHMSAMDPNQENHKHEPLKNMRTVPKRVLREFVSGVGGTGKSYLINAINLAVTKKFKKQVIVTAPTGIAAYNVNGVTLHRLLRLPIEHDNVPKYKKLSDQQLQSIREQFKDCVLLIIDEISMVSNIMLMYIHLRLSEIFDTIDVPDGWFGRINILCFGDLLQLTPVNERSPFLDILRDKCKKYFSVLSLPINPWKELFSYNELTINVRQSDSQFAEILASVRLGTLTEAQEKVLRSREIILNVKNTDECINQLADYINKLPTHTVSLFPTRKLCTELNNAMLAKIDSPEIILKAEDEIEAKTFEQKEKAKKSLKKLFKDETKTAGLESQIKIKIGAKIMLLRNLDISIGLVNGAIGTVKEIFTDPLENKIVKLNVEFATGEFQLEPVQTKFQLFSNVFSIRKQFPICLAYGITIHKSQGLTLDSCVVEIGESIFTCGQVYVALSRVKTIEGLHIINLNPANIQVQNEAIIEYNRLRKLASLNLPMLECPEKNNKKRKDRNVYTKKNSKLTKLDINFDDNVNENNNKFVLKHNFKKFSNQDNVSCYANAVLQCLINQNVINSVVLGSSESELKSIFLQYKRNGINDKLTCLNLRKDFIIFKERRQQDASEFLTELFEKYYYLKPLVQFTKFDKKECKKNCGYVEQETVPWTVCPLFLPSDITKTYTVNDIIHHNLYEKLESDTLCPNCSEKVLLSCRLESYPEVLIFNLQLGMISSVDGQFSKVINLKISKIPASTIVFGNTKYHFSSAIFHHGKMFDSGHYTAVLKFKNAWFRLDDDKITQCTWPRNGKDIYMLMYTKQKKS